MKRILAALGLSAALAQHSFAQEAVPLSDELFDWAWAVVDFEGRSDVPVETTATFHVSDRPGGNVGGQTECGTDWSAKIAIDLPKVSITDVEGFYTDECPAFRNTIALFEALEKVTAANTGPEGLELLAEDGRRLLLLTAGG